MKSKAAHILYIVGLSFAVALIVVEFPVLSEPDVMKTWGILLLMFLFYCLSLRQLTDVNRLWFTIGTTVWWFLFFAEAVLVRRGTIEKAAEGIFSHAAFGEATIWVVCVFILAFISLGNLSYLYILFRDSYKWITLFTLLALASVAYSPDPIYSLAWALKLAVIVVSLAMWASAVNNPEDIKKFLEIIHTAFLVTVMMPFFQLFADPSLLFIGGRLGGIFSPTGVSSAGGVLLLLSLILFRLNNRKSSFYKATSIIGLAIMLLGGGKTAIAAGFVSVIAFLIIIGETLTTIGFILIVSLISLSIIALKLPIVIYLHNYQESDLLWTLTGRLPLWNAAIYAILERLILGHGYVASKFSSLLIQGVQWPAGHMHNALLEVLYNNGIIGLAPILLMNLAIIKNIIRVIRNPLNQRILVLATGLLVLYIFLFLNGILTTSFGGRPHNEFMLFLALIALSHKLREASTDELSK